MGDHPACHARRDREEGRGEGGDQHWREGRGSGFLRDRSAAPSGRQAERPEAGGGNQGRGAEHRRRFRAVPGRGCEGAGQASGASDFKRNVWDHGARLLPGGDRDGSGPQGRGRGL